ncbi:MAG: HPr-rel-A system PqqD family peptide chaperone [Sphingobium sp.]|uniref:HPr-rel-A system PqqD family peptide chaperone n=1 Tax=Sphingobium sp. TaxID=1912891 RepID=UPI0029B3CA2B|nr:HPr-rel-A system PqqD family peptide chaperone [Sphingobium sp.]MDX3910343.1 HPr-rel-A system PqqD family peptide chaperone [Sphingobium sp.]
MTRPALYRAEPAIDLLIRTLDDITLIYHRRSGQTHMVMSPVPEILAAVGAGTVGAGEVLAALARDFDMGDAEEALAAIEVHLDEMAALGLVHRI